MVVTFRDEEDFVIKIWVDDSPESKAVIQAVQKLRKPFVVLGPPDGALIELPALVTRFYTIDGYDMIRGFFDLGLLERHELTKVKRS